jgi:hypothetical protein
MSIKTLLAALVLTAAPGLADGRMQLGHGASDDDELRRRHVMWDAPSQTCVPVVSS